MNTINIDRITGREATAYTPPEDVIVLDRVVASCPACGDRIDHCMGHGAIGDPVGYAKLCAHDDGDHTNCHPAGCDEVS